MSPSYTREATRGQAGTFCFLFPPFPNVCWKKEAGKIPEVLARNHGWQTIVVTHPNDGASLQPAEAPHVAVRYLPAGGRLLGYDIETGAIRFLLACARQIDVLQLYHFNPDTAVYAFFYKLLYPEGFLYLKLDMHDDWARRANFRLRPEKSPKRTLQHWLMARLIQQADLISIESERLLALLRDRFPEIAPRLVHVPSGIDIATMPRVDPDISRERWILNMARLGTHQKGTDILLEAFARSELWPEWKLVLTGPVEPSFQPWLEDYQRRHPAAWDAVWLTGPISNPAELCELYQSSTVFCLPSRYESFGIVLTEAGYFGCACVATRSANAVSEILDDGRCGILCDVDDVEALAGALGQVCRDPGWAKDLGQCLRGRILARYTWDLIGQNLDVQIRQRMQAASPSVGYGPVVTCHTQAKQERLMSNTISFDRRTFPTCVCGSVDYRTVFQRGSEYKEFDFDFFVLECKQCGLRRTLPQPQASPDAYQDNEDYKQRLDESDLYRSFARRILSEIARFKPQPGQLLDVGCNVGILLDEARQIGWDAIGVEPNGLAAKVGREAFGVDIHIATLEDAGFPTHSFDVVVMSQLLEHIDDPVGLLDQVAYVLKDDGLLFVESPNYDGLAPRLFRLIHYPWYGLCPHQHVWQLTPRGFHSIAARSQLQLVALHCRRNLYWHMRNWKWRLFWPYLRFAELVGQSDNLFAVLKRRE